MYSSSTGKSYGFDSREALRDTNPEMGGAIDVARQRQAVTLKGIQNLYRAEGLVPPSEEVMGYAAIQESTAPEVEAITRQAAEQQLALGIGAREQLQAMPDNNPVVEDRAPRTPVVPPVSEVQNQISYISQIADQHYNRNPPGMN